ncbi:YdcF family protein [Oceanirhabdus seepicola]|uniref:YdcF family protein n=1 Tax=Oceanirhabdus seepicola TaxID=2828781 RepID=A0A9J6NXD3_9CLOT|nr:YdcF family protein [Oceanirhabdus seepicola]MCM1989114.1 YdcF family protein [Oceanirhabdus seepicola]
MKIIDDITNFIFLEDEMEEADIIFIPGGSHPELGEYAAELWKEGLATYIMPSGGVSIKTGKFNGVKSKKELYSKEYKTDCEFLADVLCINGVSENSILWEDTSSFTKENAIFSRRVADENNMDIKKAILCCKSFHARRSLMCYQLAFPDTEFYIQPVPYYEKNVLISKDNWFKTEAGIKRVLGELQRCGNQFNEEIMQLREIL